MTPSFPFHGPYLQDLLQHTVLAEHVNKSAVIYIDDVLVASK